MKWSDFTTKQKVWLVVAVFALVGISKLFEEPKPATKPEIAAQPVKNEDSGVIMGDIATVTGQIIGGKTKDDLKEILTAAQTNDTYTYTEKEANGTALFLYEGTKVKVLETSWGKVRVRVMEGKTTGAACWIPREFLRKITE